MSSGYCLNADACHLYLNRQVLLHRKHIVSITMISLLVFFGKTKGKLLPARN